MQMQEATLENWDHRHSNRQRTVAANLIEQLDSLIHEVDTGMPCVDRVSRPPRAKKKPEPELDEIPEFNVTSVKTNKRSSNPPMNERRFSGFMIGDHVAREYDPYTSIGKIDMLKEGYARVREHDYARWLPNHEITLVKESRQLNYGVNYAVSHVDNPYKLLGHVAYFSNDGNRVFVNEPDGPGPSMHDVNDIVPYDPEANIYDSDNWRKVMGK